MFIHDTPHQTGAATSGLARSVAIGALISSLIALSACGSDADDAQVQAAPPVASQVVPATTAAATPVDPPTSSVEQTTTSAPNVTEPGSIDVIARDFEFVGMPDVLRQGVYPMSLTNDGDDVHEMVIFQPTTGKTLEELEAGGPDNFVNDAKVLAYFAPLAPGSVFEADVTLEPGDYMVACFVPAAVDGMGHFHHGMVKSITVVE